MNANGGDANPSATVPGIGTIIEDRYRIVGELGSGGVGSVFRAEHLKLGHHVAIKVLQPHLVTHPQFRPRFEREARALAALAHPHVVAWTDYSVTGECPYLVMELLDGRPLKTDIAAGPMDPRRVRAIVRQVIGTLIYAHRLGFVHRDLKPDNIFLLDLPTEPDFVKLLDFGFVKLVEHDGAAPEKSQLTASGMGMGTPTYMSPEQAWGDKTGPASDLYSLGIVCFEMLTGQRPFKGEITEIVRQHMTAELPPIATEQLVASPELDAFLRRVTEKKAHDRYASAEAMLEALDALPEPLMIDPRRRVSRTSATTLPPPPKPGVRWPIVAGLSVALGLAAALAVALSMRSAPSSPDAVEPTETVSETAITPPPTPTEPPAAERPRARTNENGGQDQNAHPSAPTPEVAPEPAAAPAAESPAPVAPPVQSEALGESPFDTRPRLPLLWNAHRQLVSGRTLSTSAESAIERWGRSEPDDPRPALLLAANAVRRHKDGRAVSLYLAAHRASPDARNDPRMLRNLVRLVAESRFQRAASDAVVEIYGPLASEAVERELLRPELTPVAHGRLVRLRARLTPGAVP